MVGLGGMVWWQAGIVFAQVIPLHFCRVWIIILDVAPGGQDI